MEELDQKASSSNMLPEYRQQILRSNFHDRATFSRALREAELLLRELRSATLLPARPFQSLRSPPERQDPNCQDNRPSQANRVVVTRTNQTTTANPNQESSNFWQRPGQAMQRAGPSYVRQTPAGTPQCWRCGEMGHYRAACRGPAKVFCSRCGKEGVLSRNCTCHTGN